MHCPNAGAMVGTKIKIIMINDIVWAILRPSYWSRIIATLTVRGLANPKPCSHRPININLNELDNKAIVVPNKNIIKPT